MVHQKYILALDQGTTSSRAILFDRNGTIRAQASRPFRQIYPQPGWVEHDAAEIWQTQLAVAREAIGQAQSNANEIAAIGITNQRETTILWNRKNGEPVAPAIVWQCRRSVPICERLRSSGHEPVFRKKTGLVLDAYFSGTKIRWLLDHHPELAAPSRHGDLAFGTVDSWLLFKLTAGKVHATDPSNASRTLLYNLEAGGWDQELLDLLGVPRSFLPEVKSSSAFFGETAPELFGKSIPVAGIAGDQQASLLGHGCFEPGSAKNTFGTGAFILCNTGEKRVVTESGLITTVAWQVNGKTSFALEGSVFISGAAVQWLRDELKLIDSSEQIEGLARSVPDNGGVYFVPAFVGLGAPYWDPQARGIMVGLTRGTNRGHIARAVLEAMAYQTRDVLEIVRREGNTEIPFLRVDGGAARNDLLCQFQADILGCPVARSRVVESTALGTAFLAGLAVGFWRSFSELAQINSSERMFEPEMAAAARDGLYERWLAAVERSRRWAKD